MQKWMLLMMITNRDRNIAFDWMNVMIFSFHPRQAHSRGFCNRPISNRGKSAWSLSKLHSPWCRQTPNESVFMTASWTAPISMCLFQLSSSLVEYSPPELRSLCRPWSSVLLGSTPGTGMVFSCGLILIQTYFSLNTLSPKCLEHG